ncbi:C4-dicarboxylate TRAP transporter large permease protein DctM [bioreactor metagenome]|uniref:C4-dicarboxylate TRAP transporter large permease protein DctM n=1 Tax=bioreactor metagenome TaxID=1076179 RepID=A0A645FRU0_9ZZZZ
MLAGLFIYKELTFQTIKDNLLGTSITVGTILIIVGTGTTLGRILTMERVPTMIADAMLGFTSNPIVILLLINLFLLVVGCVMETLAAILILGPILYPIVAVFDINIIHFGLIMVINLAIGFITPPVGVNLFVACGISDLSFEKLCKAIIPFIIALFIALMVITYWSPLTMFLPKLVGLA